jgi:hypothetical protein
MLVDPVSSLAAKPARSPDSAKAPPRVKDLVLVGTVVEVAQGDGTSLNRWVVALAVERIVSGDFSGPIFTFAIHSPARAGLEIGKSCTIKATWTKSGYVSKEPQVPCP